MSELPAPQIGAFAIVPANDLAKAKAWWERLRFTQSNTAPDYLVMQGWDGFEVHLIQAGQGPWAVPDEHNPFGVFIRTPRVAEIAAIADDLIIRPGGILRHREWGIYECGLLGHDGMLVRIGWPSRLIQDGKA